MGLLIIFRRVGAALLIAACGGDNAAPVAGDDRLVTGVDTKLVVGADAPEALLANDEDPDGGVLVVRDGEVASERGGSAALADDGLTYTPAAGFWGCDGFAYEVADLDGGAASADVRVAVLPTRAELERAAEVGSGVRFAVGEVELGGTVAGVGDVDGDGFADVAIGAGRGGDLRVYVVRGGEDLAERTLDGVAAGQGGFVVDLGAGDPSVALVVRGAGDVDGDGLDDLIIGGDPTLGVFVVLGRTDSAAVDAAALRMGDGRGFVIVGESAEDLAGAAVDAAGDVDGDGRGDLLVGAPGFVGEEGVHGRVYVVYGRGAGAPVQLSAVAAGDGGYTITPKFMHDDGFGALVGGGQDVNGDGRPDVVAGTRSGYLRAHVVFGRADGSAVRLVYESGAGFLVYTLGPQFGYPDPMSPLQQLELSPDMNGDGLAEVVFHTGDVAVVYGKADTEIVEVGVSPRWGRELEAVGAGPAAAVGDLDGDGLAEVMVAARDPSFGSDWKKDPGQVLVFRGSDTSRSGEEPVVHAWTFVGGTAGGDTGRGAARAGDVDGDGVVDLAIGTPRARAVHVVTSGACP
jgi:hypothetical protein